MNRRTILVLQHPVCCKLDNTCGAGGAQRNVGRPGKMTKSGKNESFCEGMVKALITKMTKSDKNEPFCEGMVKALFFKKSQKSVQKSAQNRGQPCRRLASQKWTKRTFFFGFFRNLEITTKNNPKGTSNCFPYDYQPHNFRKSRRRSRSRRRRTLKGDCAGERK